MTLSRPALGRTEPPIKWVYGAISPGVKRPGREANPLRMCSEKCNLSRLNLTERGVSVQVEFAFTLPPVATFMYSTRAP